MKNQITEDDFTMYFEGSRRNIVETNGTITDNWYVYGRNDDVVTERGIRLGDKKEQVISKYGESTERFFDKVNDILYAFNKNQDGEVCGDLATLEECDTYVDYKWYDPLPCDSAVAILRFYFGKNDKLKLIGMFAVFKNLEIYKNVFGEA